MKMVQAKIAAGFGTWRIMAEEALRQFMTMRKAMTRMLQAKLAAAGNPLEEAALESDLDRILRESDRILRYVRRRFNTEMDTRRRLAEERRLAELERLRKEEEARIAEESRCT